MSVPLPPEWITWVDAMKAYSNTLRMQINYMWYAIVVLMVIIVILGWLVGKYRNTPRQVTADFSMAADVPTITYEQSPLAEQCDQLVAQNTLLEQEIARLNGVIDRLREDDQTIIPVQDVVTAEEDIEVSSISGDGDEVTVRLFELAKEQEQRGRELLRAYRIIVLHMQHTGGWLIESLSNGVVLDGSSVYVCPTQVLAAMIGRDGVIADGMRGERGIARFKVTFREGRLMDIRPVFTPSH